MNETVERLEFEKAAEIRDKISKLNSISSKQKVVSDDFEDRDIIAVAYEGKESACSILNIRDGKLVGKKQLRLSINENEEIAEIYSSVIKFYYTDFVEIPKEIILEIEPADSETLGEWLNLRSTKKMKFVIPKRGSLNSLVKMCKENAALQLKEIQLQKMKAHGQVPYSVSALQRLR